MSMNVFKHFWIGVTTVGVFSLFAWSIPFSSSAALPTFETNPHILTSIGAIAGTNSVIVEEEAKKNLKEYVLDGLVPAIREGMTAAITQNIVAWINNGFDGGPGYVTDLNGFLGQVADNTALDFLQGTEFDFLCSPFQLQVRQALILDYLSRNNFANRISCTLGNSLAGQFLSGDFYRGGGWASLFRLSTNFQNNPYSAYLQAQDELSVRIASRTGEEKTLLDFGGGFFSKGTCVNPTQNVSTNSSIDINTQSGCVRAGGTWQIVTPGAIINDSLSQTLGSGFRQLELADEINEIIGALMAQVIQQSITSINGLAGLSSNHSSSAINGRSYLQSVINESQTNSFDATKEELVGKINASIGTEQRYQGVLTTIANGYSAAQDGFNSVNDCAGTKALQALGTAASSTATSIQTTLDSLQARIDASSEEEQRLTDIAAQAQNATTQSELDAAYTAYNAELQSGNVHDSNSITLLINENNETHQPAITDLQQKAADDLALCEGS